MSTMKWKRSKGVKGICKNKITNQLPQEFSWVIRAERICRVWWGSVKGGGINELEILVESLVESGKKRKNTEKTGGCKTGEYKREVADSEDA